jgi:hypothetical protein
MAETWLVPSYYCFVLFEAGEKTFNHEEHEDWIFVHAAGVSSEQKHRVVNPTGAMKPCTPSLDSFVLFVSFVVKKHMIQPRTTRMGRVWNPARCASCSSAR